jgi:hypothetical protein
MIIKSLTYFKRILRKNYINNWIILYKLLIKIF